MPVLRIGIVGGTFDPPHNGHLAVAANAAAQLGLDRTLLVVANAPWQKVGEREVTAADDRLAMVAAVVADAGAPGLEASDLEVVRGGLTYTADTLAEVERRWPGSRRWLIVGTDVARSLGTWKRLEEVRSLAALAIVDRDDAPWPRAELEADGWTVDEVVVPRLDISSSDIRARLASGFPIDGLVPPAAIRLIRERGLYADIE